MIGHGSKDGAGTWILSNANTYIGGTALNAGTLQVQSSAALGTGTLTFTGGATLQAGANNLNLANAVTTAGTSNVDTRANTLTLSGIISGTGTLTKLGTGTLVLSNAANTYSGGTAINAGTVQAVAAGNLGSGGITFGGDGTGTPTLSTTGTFTLGQAVTLNQTGTFNTANGTTLTADQAITGAGGLVKIGTGTLALGSPTNSYTGATTVSAGTLALTGTGSIGPSSTVALATNGTFDISGLINGGTSVKGLSNTAAGQTGSVILGANTLTLTAANASFGGVISGTGGLTLADGTQTLTGTNTYSGATILTGGILNANSSAALGDGSATNTLIFNGGTLQAGGAITSPATRGVSLNGGTTNTIDTNGFAVSIAGIIANGTDRAGALTKAGAGTLTLTATNTYGGGTTISAGTLQLGSGAGGGATGSITGDVADDGTLAFNRSNALTFGGTISGTGTVAQIGGGTTTLTGANTYRGGTTIDAGTLSVGADANLGAGSGALAFGGGTLATTASFAMNRAVTLNAGGGTFAPATGTILTEGGVIAGSGLLTIAGAGTLLLTGTNTYTGATTINAGATLQLGNGGTAGSIAGTTRIVDNGALVFNRSDTLTVAAAISGAGTLTQAGTGTTVLSGQSPNFSGTTTVNAGTLQVDGLLGSANVTVNRGGTLAGSGKIGDPIINSGGTLAPGSSSTIGTLAITGPLTFADGSFYTVKITPTANDRTNVTGTTTIQGGTVQVLAGAGTYTPDLRYALLTSSGGVTGRFTNLQTTSNLAFLTPSLSYDANTVYLGFAQTAAITTQASTPNQTGPAAALNGVAPTVTTTVTTNPTTGQTTTQTTVSNVTPAAQVAVAVLNQTAPGAVQALNSLSGEIHASAISAEMQTAFLVQEAILDHLRFGESNGFGGPGLGSPGLTGAIGQRFSPGTTLPAMYSADVGGEPVVSLVPVRPVQPTYAVWGQAFGAFGDTTGNRNAARLARQTGGFVLGAEVGPEVPGGVLTDWRVGVAAGYTFTALDVTARQSTGQVESGFGAVYARASLGPVQVRLGAAYAGNALDTKRAVLFPGFSQSVSGKTGGETVQGFGEVGYRIGFAQGYIEPFVGGAAIHIGRDRFAETGGSSALTVFGRTYEVETATAGLQGHTVLSSLFGTDTPIIARGLIGYRRAFGDVVPQALLAFSGGGQAFLTSGTPIARDAVVASAGLDVQVARNVSVGLNYTGQVGERAQDHAVKGSFSYRW